MDINNTVILNIQKTEAKLIFDKASEDQYYQDNSFSFSLPRLDLLTLLIRFIKQRAVNLRDVTHSVLHQSRYQTLSRGQ